MLPHSMQAVIDQVARRFGHYPRLPVLFANTFSNTCLITLQPQDDGTTFVITADIPAMWRRDSAAQVRPCPDLARTDPALPP